MKFKRRNQELLVGNVIDMEPYQLAHIALVSNSQEDWEVLTAHYYRYGYVQDASESDVPTEEDSHYDGKAFKKYNRKKKRTKKSKKKDTGEEEKT